MGATLDGGRPTASRDLLGARPARVPARIWIAHSDVMESPPLIVHLHGHPGVIRSLAAPDDSHAAAYDPHAAPEPVGWVWEGRLDPVTFASLLRAAMQGGRTPCTLSGRPYWVLPRVCWYDAQGGRVLLELHGPPEPASIAVEA
jgi:hypothetical protein